MRLPLHELHFFMCVCHNSNLILTECALRSLLSNPLIAARVEMKNMETALIYPDLVDQKTKDEVMAQIRTFLDEVVETE